MLANYFRSALRYLMQNKLFASINALGLTLALASSFCLLLYIINELSYDHCFKNSRRIYRVLYRQNDVDRVYSGTPYILASKLKEEFPQIERAINLRPLVLFIELKNGSITSKAQGTDSDIFNLFLLPLIFGDPNQNLLEDKNSIVLSRELAQKIFPGENPMGKEIKAGVNSNQLNIFIVKGVFENIPKNSTIQAQCFVNSKWTLDQINRAFKINNADMLWDKDFWFTWILLSKDGNAKTLETQFKALENKYLPKHIHQNYLLQNLLDVYLKSDMVENTGIKGNITSVQIYSAIVLLILLVAAINYIILSTAVSSGRIKEIAMRKAYGASKQQIELQLLSESVLSTIIVLPVSLILMLIAIPYASILFQTQLHLIRSNIIIYILVYLGLTIFIGIVSGIYTSSYLSRLNVMNILKNSIHSGKKRLYFRSALIVLQIFLFCTFISNSLIIRSQYKYAKTKDLGYYNTNILFFHIPPINKSYPVLINNINSIPNVISTSGIREELPMTNSASSLFPNFKNKEVNVEVESITVDYDFLKTMGITIIKGRDFSKEYGSDISNSVILNETAIKRLGIDDPIGKMLGIRTIIGVVKDFNLHSIRSDIIPVEIIVTDKYINDVAVRYRQGTLGSVLPAVVSEWKKIFNIQFSYKTIDEVINNTYSSEKNLNIIVSILSLITMLISGFGLFGLTLFVAKTRAKEIGIKKVFGSSELAIVYSSLRTNLIFVLLAALLSTPVTLLLMRKWLSNFAFKVNINIGIFVFAFILAVLVVFLTVIIHSVKASRINPVKALRYE
jgi:putative ABC transport system permease protein